jgi:hypothetical protein
MIMTNSVKSKVLIDNKEIEYVDQYIYLGKQISFGTDSHIEEIERRIALSWKKYWSYEELLKGNFNLRPKTTEMDTCILPSLTYGCQTWVHTNKIKSKIRTCQRAMERSILNVKNKDKINSKSIRSQTKFTDTLDFILKQKWRWAGHIARITDKRWTNETTKWPGPLGKRRVGRPKARWSDDIIAVAGPTGLITLRTEKNGKTWRRPILIRV